MSKITTAKMQTATKKKFKQAALLTGEKLYRLFDRVANETLANAKTNTKA